MLRHAPPTSARRWTSAPRSGSERCSSSRPIASGAPSTYSSTPRVGQRSERHRHRGRSRPRRRHRERRRTPAAAPSSMAPVAVGGDSTRGGAPSSAGGDPSGGEPTAAADEAVGENAAASSGGASFHIERMSGVPERRRHANQLLLRRRPRRRWRRAPHTSTPVVALLDRRAGRRARPRWRSRAPDCAPPPPPPSPPSSTSWRRARRRRRGGARRGGGRSARTPSAVRKEPRTSRTALARRDAAETSPLQ